MREMDKLHQTATREINRKLQQDVRADWDFPATTVATEEHTTGTNDGVHYRERYYGTTDDSSDDDGLNAHTIEDMYAFDSPDSVGDELERKLSERTRRKRLEMEEELLVNPGLCFFLRRRNAWTGAVKKRTDDAMEGMLQQPKLATSSDSSPMHTPTSASSAPPAEGPARTSLETPSPLPQAEPAFRAPDLPSTLTDVLVPVAPPLIPATNAVRISISNRSPSEIYGKVVRDSRTPAVPINLAEMTRIIVQGWKDEGNWPPRGSVPEASIAGRRSTKVHEMVEGHGLLAHHPHLQRGVEGMKRVFRLSGGHHSGSHEEVKTPKSPKSSGGGGGLDSAFRSHD